MRLIRKEETEGKKDTGKNGSKEDEVEGKEKKDTKIT